MKIFVNGIQRTGTNYTRELLQINTDYEVNEYQPPYWKHDTFSGIIPECDLIYCVIKNPYTWIESICFRNCVDIIEKNPHLYNNKDYLGPFKINLIEACKLYKTFYSSWIKYGVKLIHYEDLLNESYLKELLNKEKVIIPQKVNFSHNFKYDYIEYYKNYQLFHLNDNHINVINEILGNDFLEIIGYTKK